MSKPPEKSDAETFIKSIKEKSSAQKYLESRFFHNLFQELDNQIRNVLRDIPSQLGSDWSSIQSGGPLGPTEYKNHFAPYSKVYNFTGETIIHGFVTGNELVIHIQERDAVHEVLRQPIEGEINWPQFRERLNNHYLKQIYKVI
jgi:hypothetical protein